MKRRDLIKGLGVAGVAACTGVFAGPKLLSALATAPSNFTGFTPETDPWSQLPAILARIKPPVFRILIWAVAAILIISIGLSRIYLGVHYPTDVIAGYLAAAVWVSTMIAVDHWRTRRNLRTSG